MPRMDGRETLRRLRKSSIWTPTILLTQVGEASERALALEEGADDYLNKPFDPHELLARVRAVFVITSYSIHYTKLYEKFRHLQDYRFLCRRHI